MKRITKKKRYTKKQYSRKKNMRKKRYSRKNKKTLSRKKKRYSKKRLVGGAEGEDRNSTSFDIIIDYTDGRMTEETSIDLKITVNQDTKLKEIRNGIEENNEGIKQAVYNNILQWYFKDNKEERFPVESESKISVIDFIEGNYEKTENKEDISDEQENYRNAETEYLVRNELEELKKEREELKELKKQLSENYQKSMEDIDSQKENSKKTYEKAEKDRQKYYSDLFNNYSKGLKGLCDKQEEDDLTPEDTEQCLIKLKNDIDWAKENKATKDYYDQTLEEKNRETEKECSKKIIEQSKKYEDYLEKSKKDYEKADRDRENYYFDLFNNYSKGLKGLCGKNESDDLTPKDTEQCLIKLINKFNINKNTDNSPDVNNFFMKINKILKNVINQNSKINLN